MRGIYTLTHDDRIKFFHSLLELCKDGVDNVDLVSTQLSLCNCADLLGELDYEQTSWDVNGWEGEVWAIFEHPTAPRLSLFAEAYDGGLEIWWTGVDDGEDINTESLKEVMREKWGKYFPII